MVNKIVMDSGGDLTMFSGVDFSSVPLLIRAGEQEYVDDAALDAEAMARLLKESKCKSTTACPGVQAYLDAFEEAEQVFCITMTSKLSGSFNSAMVAARTFLEEHPLSKIHVIDSLSTGPGMILLAEKLRELIAQGVPFENVVEAVEAYRQRTKLLFSLESLRNLANSGRLPHALATVAGMLGIRFIGRANDGVIEPVGNARGEKRLIADLVKQVCASGYEGGKMIINHCCNQRVAEQLREQLCARFPSAAIRVGKLGGLCSFYAEHGGLIIGFEIA